MISDFAQSIIDVISWTLSPFAFILVITWVCSLFRRD